MTPMRRIVTFNRVTADGFFSGPHGNLDWAVPEEALDRSAADALGGADTMLFGRRTYELFEGFWPDAVDDLDTAPDPHAPGRTVAEIIGRIGLWINQAAKLVFSSTLKNVSWKNSRILPAFDPRRNPSPQAATRQRHHRVRQRLHRVATHRARIGRRVPVHRESGSPRQRTVRCSTVCPRARCWTCSRRRPTLQVTSSFGTPDEPRPANLQRELRDSSGH